VTSDEPGRESTTDGNDSAPASAGPSKPDPAESHPTTETEPARALREVDRARRRRAAKAVVGLTVLVVLVLFVVWNSQPGEVNFVFGKAHPRMIWVMVACAVLGGVLGYLLGRPGHEGRRKEK